MAGANGEFTGVKLIAAYHKAKGRNRKKMLIPDAAHGTNPASAALAGFETVNIESRDGMVDPDALAAAIAEHGEDVAGLMMTCPNTLGLMELYLPRIVEELRKVDALLYYDGANMNAQVGLTNPGYIGADVCHLNLHKTFSTPHGGGGPGSGPVGCKAMLEPFLPTPRVQKAEGSYSLYTPAQTMGQVRSFYGNFLVVVKALAYLLTLGKEGIPEASAGAVLNANYLMKQLADGYDMSYPGLCMHEFVMTLQGLAHDTGVTAMDVAKRLLDFGIHPPTMYFPLHRPRGPHGGAHGDREPGDPGPGSPGLPDHPGRGQGRPGDASTMPPTTCAIGRPDEVTAARHPVLRYDFGAEEG